MAFGVTPEGFSKKRFDDLVAEFKDEFAASFDSINTSDDAIAGLLINIWSKQLSDQWELQEAVYNAYYPSTANGVPLDHVGDVVGITRLDATNSKVTLSAKGSQGTLIPIGRLIEVTETLEQFTSLTEVTIDKAVAINLDLSVNTVADATDYTVTVNGTPFTHNSGAGATAINIMAGLKSVIDAGAEPVTYTDNLDGTGIVVADDVATAFNGSVSVNLTIDDVTSPMPSEAVNTGAVVGVAGTLIAIITPIAGWDSVTNINDAALGREIETDAEFRLRRAESLQIAGVATVEAIQARIAELDDVTAVVVIENRTLITDGGGRPGKSYETVVAGGDNAEIAVEIWNTKPAGIETFGTVEMIVTDSQGNSQSIFFSRATQIFCWLRITVTKNLEESFPADGVTQITDNVLAEAIKHGIGADIILDKFVGPTMDVSGIATVVVEIATSATEGGPPGAYQTTNLVIAATEAGDFDSVRISVVEV